MRRMLGRRQALGLLGAATLVRLTGDPRATGAACDPTRPSTAGPFWIDDNLRRSDVTTDPSDGTVRPGVPLRLRLRVVRSDAACAPAAGVQVDLWHCDAEGRYSDDPDGGVPGGRFLRGWQVTDADGAVEFRTIYPGWYPGRTIHVHVRARAGAVDFASQLYFDDAVSEVVLAAPPYAGRSGRTRTNADDGLYQPGLRLTLAPDGAGWLGTYDVALAELPGGPAAQAVESLDARIA